MNPAVGDEPLNRLPGDRRNGSKLDRMMALACRRDQFDAGCRFERPDVPAFAADDASLEIVARQMTTDTVVSMACSAALR
jgi:hypothetical protein